MNKESLAAFIELAELDQKIKRLHGEQKAILSDEAQINEKKEALAQEIVAAHRAVNDAQKAIDYLDLEFKTLDQQLSRIKEKSLSAKNQKELLSLEHEQETIKEKKNLQDDTGLMLLENLEKAKHSEANLIAQKPEKEQALLQSEEELVNRKKHITNLLRSYDEQRLLVTKKVDDDLLAQYDQMKKQVPDPVVPVIKGSCLSCFYALSQSELVSLNHDLITCQGCYRLLYIHPALQDIVHDES